MVSNEIAKLHAAIRSEHHCESRHIGTHPETETVGALQWRGKVESFELFDHPTARYCYAWFEPDGRITTVLQIPPVISPSTALGHVLRERWQRTRVMR